MSAELPPGYFECAQKMLAAAGNWLLCRGFGGITFTLPDPKWMVIAALTPATVELIAETPEARALVSYMDERTNHEGTLFLASVVIRELGLPFTVWPESKLAALVARGAIGSS